MFSADEALGMVYVPTGNRTPDYFGGSRSPAEDPHSSAVVAIDIDSGATRWVFQTVHHDIWDYDVAAQPVLFDLTRDGGRIPVLLIAPKTGQLFVLDRRSGQPVFRLEERTVPQGAVAGEHLSPTQPFSVELPALHPTALTENELWGLTPLDRAWCRRKFNQYRHDGLFTPQSLQGTVNFPSNLGAINWGSVAIDPRHQIVIANTNRIASLTRLIPR